VIDSGLHSTVISHPDPEQRIRAAGRGCGSFPLHGGGTGSRPEEDAEERGAVKSPVGLGQADLRHEIRHEFLVGRGAAHPGEEVAVAAAVDAERDVEIDPGTEAFWIVDPESWLGSIRASPMKQIPSMDQTEHPPGSRQIPFRIDREVRDPGLPVDQVQVDRPQYRLS